MARRTSPTRAGTRSRALSVDVLYAGQACPLATGLSLPFPRGLPLSPAFVNDKIQTL